MAASKNLPHFGGGMTRKKQSVTLTNAKRYVRRLTHDDFDLFWQWMSEKYLDEDHPLDLTWTLSQDDDLISVLRGHLLTEARLSALLALRFPHSDAVLDELGFAEKCRLARRQAIIDRELTRALTALGHLRDSFAHLPLKVEVSEEDEAEFLESFTPESRELIREWAAGGALANQQRTVTRCGIAMISRRLREIELQMTAPATT